MLRMQSRVVASAARLITVPARFATTKKPLSLYLIKDVPGVGSFGEKVEVKHGFGRNYLIPQGFALYATPENREVMYIKHNVDPEATAAAADAEDEAAAAESARTAHRPYFDAGARTISNLNWRFRRTLMNPKGDSLEIRNPITKEHILSMLRGANIHHASLSDIVFPPGVESLNTYGAYTFAIRYAGADACDWVTVVAGIFPPLDATIEVTKSLLKKERSDIIEERERRMNERREYAKKMDLQRRRKNSEEEADRS